MDDAKKQASLYLRMGELLSKQRSPESYAKVQEIINSDKSLEEKIKLIEEIDSIDKGEKLIGAPALQNEEKEIIKKKGFITKEVAQNNLKNIKYNIKKSSLLNYIFSEYFKLRKYSYYNPCIKVSLLPPTVKINPDVLTYLFNRIQKKANELYPIINYVLDNGWIILEKIEYNLIVVFKQLIDELMNDNFKKMFLESFDINRFKNLEEKYVICMYKNEYLDMLKSSVRATLKTNVHYADRIDLVINDIDDILNPHLHSGYNLMNFIIALNIYRYKKFLKYEDIYIPNMKILDNLEYDAIDKVKTKIIAYINETEKKLGELFKEKNEISAIKQFLGNVGIIDFSDLSKIDYSILIAFYNFESSKKKINFEFDKNNIMLFLYNFIERFLIEMDHFINAKYRHSGIDINVFTSDFFYVEFNRLNTLIQKFSKVSFSTDNLSIYEIPKIIKKGSNNTGTHDEIFITQILKELNIILLEVGKKTAHLYKAYDKEYLEEEFKSLDPSILFKTKYKTSFWDKKVFSKGYFYDKDFGSGLYLMSSICILAEILFYDTHIIGVLENEIKVNDEINRIKKVLERMDNPLNFERLRKIYNF